MPAHDELIHLQPYGSSGEGILARLCGINADYNLIFAFRHRAAEIYDSVELTEPFFEPSRNIGDFVEVGPDNSDIQASLGGTSADA